MSWSHKRRSNSNILCTLQGALGHAVLYANIDAKWTMFSYLLEV